MTMRVRRRKCYWTQETAPRTPGKSESVSRRRKTHFRHQTVLIESGRSEEDAGSEEAG